MKNKIMLLLVLSLLFSIVGCGTAQLSGKATPEGDSIYINIDEPKIIFGDIELTTCGTVQEFLDLGFKISFVSNHSEVIEPGNSSQIILDVPEDKEFIAPDMMLSISGLNNTDEPLDYKDCMVQSVDISCPYFEGDKYSDDNTIFYLGQEFESPFPVIHYAVRDFKHKATMTLNEGRICGMYLRYNYEDEHIFDYYYGVNNMSDVDEYYDKTYTE